MDSLQASYGSVHEELQATRLGMKTDLKSDAFSTDLTCFTKDI